VPWSFRLDAPAFTFGNINPEVYINSSTLKIKGRINNPRKIRALGKISRVLEQIFYN
jgi:hypothetical protein